MKVKVSDEAQCFTFTYYVRGGFLFPIAESALWVGKFSKSWNIVPPIFVLEISAILIAKIVLIRDLKATFCFLKVKKYVRMTIFKINKKLKSLFFL